MRPKNLPNFATGERALFRSEPLDVAEPSSTIHNEIDEFGCSYGLHPHMKGKIIVVP
jgi:hypothetical protein